MRIFKKIVLLTCIYFSCLTLSTYAQISNNYYLKLKVSPLGANFGQSIYAFGMIQNPNSYINMPHGFINSSLRYLTFDRSLKEFSEKNQIGIFTGIDKSGLKTIIVDANNNKDFKDDKTYIVTKKQDTSFKVKLAGSYHNGTTIRDTVFSMILNSRQKIILNSDSIQQQLGVTFFNDAVLSAAINVGLYTYKFVLSKPVVPGSTHNALPVIYMSQLDAKNVEVSSEIHQLKDTVRIQNNLYCLNNVNYNKPKLDLIFLSKEKDTGVQVGDEVANFQAKDIINSKLISPSMFMGKYILLDFWGTWCSPCLKGIPDLVSLNKRYSKQIQIISISNDKKQKLNELKKVINEKSMTWSQVWDENNADKLVEKFKITAFPTFILVDTDGKIVYRNEGIFSLKQISLLLK